jgi:WD40 repeat protein/serine/threonine protein kinase
MLSAAMGSNDDSDTAVEDTRVALDTEDQPTSKRRDVDPITHDAAIDAPRVSVDSAFEQLPTVPADFYDTVTEFAKGGIGRISEARDRRLDRVIALKELRRNTPYAQSRFAREVRITAKLQHPSIIPLHEAGRWPTGEPFFAMKLVEGGSLEDSIDSCVTLKDHLRLVRNVADVADAIAYAHSQEIVHRDLKPSNVLVGPFGETVVIDWGLAKDLNDKDEPEVDPTDGETLRENYHTTDGVVLGTPPYMPPEQAAGRAVDERADVYAIGAILYHVLSARVPYFEYHPRDIVAKVVSRKPTPLQELQKDLPPDLLAIVEKAMARDPDERYPTAGEMSRELRLYIDGGLVGAYEYSFAEHVRRFVSKNLAAVATGSFAVILLAAFGAWSFGNITEQRNKALENEKIANENRNVAERQLAKAILQEARTAVGQDPTYALARLKALKASIPGAASVAADADERGVARYVLMGHNDHIQSLAFSADSKMLATSAIDGSIQLWQVDSGSGVPLNVHEDRVPALAFSGNTLLSVSYDNQVMRWDTSTHAPTRLGNHTAPVKAVAISPDSKRVLSVGDDGVRFWSLDNGESRLLDAHADRPLFASFASDGAHALTGSHDGKLRVWSVEGDEHITLEGHRGDINGAQWSPDGHWIASAGSDGTVKLWNVNRETHEPRELAGHPGGVMAVAFTPDGKHVISGGTDGVVRLSSVDGTHTRVVSKHTASIQALSISPKEGRLIAAASWDKSISLHDRATGSNRTLLGHKDVVSAVAFSPDGKWLASTSWDHDARLWRIETGARRTLRGHEAGVKAVAFSPDGARVASGSHDNTVRIWDAKTGELLRTHEGHNDHVFRVLFSPDGKWVASSSDDRTVRLSSVDSEKSTVLSGHEADVEELAFSADGKLLASAGEDNAVGFWEVPGGARKMLRGHGDVISDVEFNKDGTLASASHDGTIRLWDHTGKLVRTLVVKSKVKAIAFSPDGSTLAASSDDNRVTLWSIADGTEHTVSELHGAERLAFSPDGSYLAIASGVSAIQVCPMKASSTPGCHAFEGHTTHVHALVFTKDSKSLLSGSADHTLRVWSVATHESRTLRGHLGPIFDVALSPDGSVVASASADMTVRLWPVEMPPKPDQLKAWLDAATTHGALVDTR